METRRLILFTALAFVVYSLWSSWQSDYPPSKTVTTQQHTETKTVSGDDHLLPHMSDDVQTHNHNYPVEEVNETSNKTNLISVKTDVFDIQIDPAHGDIVSASLIQYPESTEDKSKPFELLYDNQQNQYVANSSLFIVKDQQVKNLNFNFKASQTNYRLDGEKNLTVTLNGEANGLSVKKEFLFTKGSYLVKVRYLIDNQSDSAWKGYMNTQLLQSSPKEDKSSIFHIGSFTGASYSVPGEQRFQKVSFDKMKKNNLSVKSEGGWVAMQQHYFLSAWVPDQNSNNRFYTRSITDDYTIGIVSNSLTIPAGSQKTIGSKLYLGPEIGDNLKAIAPGLDLTIDYGWLWFLSSFLFWVMKGIYSFVGNWGWTIVLVTVLIKLAFYRLSATSYKSMAAMRKLQPKLQALKERYGDDKAKISKATMELYQKEKVNPLGGCLPILVQIPVFIALYWVLLESVQLRQAPFIFWIQDLAAADPYHILPLIMGGTMLIQQKLNPAPPDPMQAKIMMFLPVLFTALFWNFPSGLVLYWIVNNTLSILQQWYITRKYSDNKPQKKLAAANK